MDRINEYLLDPVWWFTAVFIAIMASTIAGFLKDIIAKVLSSMFQSFAEWKKQRDKTFQAEIEHLLSNHTLLLLHTSHTHFRMSSIFTIMIFYTITGVFFITVVEDPSIKTIIKLILGFMTYLSGAAGLYTIWRIAPDILLMKRSYQEYLERSQQEDAKTTEQSEN